MLRVAALTGGRSVPSARFRVRQHRDALAGLGIQLREYVAPFGSYPPRLRLARPLWGGAALLTSAVRAGLSHLADVTLLQREFVSTFSTLEGLTRSPRVLDVDDAIFLLRGGAAARRLAEICDRVICGNDYLAEWFGRWNRDVVVLPTAVDTDVYRPTATAVTDGPVIGWIGTSGNLGYVKAIEGALLRVLESSPQARLLLVTDGEPRFPSLPKERLEVVRWTEASEVELLRRMSIGIMPLEDSDWARGKCSFKMLQYMACGIPVVVSPVGMNAEVLAVAECGLAARSESEWVESLTYLLGSAEARLQLGASGRRTVVERYSVARIAPRLAAALSGVPRG